MPIQQTAIIKDAAGRTIVLSGNEQVSHSDLFTCDSPRCEARNLKATTFEWNEEDAGKNPNNLPDGFFGIIQILPDPLSHNRVVFCSPRCAKDWLTYSYVPPVTGKEIKERLAKFIPAEPAAQAAIEAQNPQMKLPFPEPESDATGYSEATNGEN